MILLNPVVQILVGPMAHGFAEFCPDCPWVTVVPIRRHPGWVMPVTVLADWVGRPNGVKLHGSVLHAMSWGQTGSEQHRVLPIPLTSAACIARKVILCVRSPFAACNTASQ
jgi:hypothetical protein